MTEGPNEPEHIPSPEERRRNRENARSAAPGEQLENQGGSVPPQTGQISERDADASRMATQAKGRNGTVVFDGNFVSIMRKGFLARATVGKGEKRIPLASISAVQLKPAGAVANGFIQFTMPGGNERRSSFGKQNQDAAGDENSVMFTKAQMPAFVALRHEIEQAIVARTAPQSPVAAPVNVPEQIQQLASLRDQGILNDAEFEAKKADLLARM